METIERTLKMFGLNDTDIRIYLSLAQSGTAAATTLAKRIGLPRSTVHYTCQRLKRQGLISLVQRKNVFLFSANDPTQLSSLIDGQKQQLQRQEQQLQGAIQQLQSLRKEQAVLPKLRQYEGVDGTVTGWMDMLDDVDEGGCLRSFSHPVEGHDAGYATLQRFVTARKAKNVRSQVIACDTASGWGLRENDTVQMRETRIMPGACGHAYCSEIMMTPTKICMGTLHEGQAGSIIIENGAVAQMLLHVFSAHWALAAPGGV
jgi:predicted transcriptional regulator